MLTDYTTYAEIRATLGVSDEELEDTTLALPLYERQLVLHLEDIDDGLPALYTTISAIAELSRTTAQQKFYTLVRLFSTYAVSKDLLGSMNLFSPKRITDGRAEVERFVDVFEDVRTGVASGFQNMRTRLRAAAIALDPTISSVTTSLVFAVGTGLATDPVTE